MKTWSIFILTIFLSTCVTAQIQKGSEIKGEAPNDGSGVISMPDANTIAIGAPNNSGNAANSGHVRIFYWNNSEWMQKGADIDGNKLGDLFGSSISMPDANTVAIGAPSSRGLNKLGYVRVYIWNGILWTQKGGDILGDATNTLTGFSVSMPDTNTVAISAIYRDGSGYNDNGRVRVYNWDGTRWTQKGANIFGDSTTDYSGYSLSMSDANTLAIGSPGNNGKGKKAGHVRVFYWNTIEWVKKGADIDGELDYEGIGSSISMPDSNTIAITGGGFARVYKWTGTAWIKVGGNIGLGSTVSMPNPITIAIGQPVDSGSVKVYKWNGANWIKIGVNIFGDSTGDRFGNSICMIDENLLAIGAPGNDGNGNNAGQVRVYSYINVGILKYHLNNLNIYPNPTNDIINIEGLISNESTTINIYDLQGKLILTKELIEQGSIDISDLNNAVYIIKIGEIAQRIVKM